MIESNSIDSWDTWYLEFMIQELTQELTRRKQKRKDNEMKTVVKNVEYVIHDTTTVEIPEHYFKENKNLGVRKLSDEGWDFVASQLPEGADICAIYDEGWTEK